MITVADMWAKEIMGTWDPVEMVHNQRGARLILEQPSAVDVTFFGDADKTFLRTEGAFIVVARPTTAIRRWLLRLATR